MDPPKVNGELTPIIQPRVRDRWLGLVRRDYDANAVRTILEGTNYGRLYMLHAMYELLEETWPRVNQNLHAVRSTVSRLDWQVVPFTIKGEKATDSAMEKAKFVESLFWNMRSDVITNRNGSTDIIYDVMDAYGKGVAVLEIDFDPARPRGEYRPLGARWLRSVYYDYPISSDAQDRLLLCRTGRPETELEEFPPNKFIMGAFKFRSAATVSKMGLLRCLAPWWVFTNFATEWLMTYAQIFGVPIRWANYTSPNNKGPVAEMMENLGAVGWAAFPTGTDLKVFEGSKSTGDNPNAFVLEYADALADIVILGQTLAQNPGSSGSGSRALGEVHERVLAGRTKHAAFWAGDVLTDSLARAICRLNYGSDEECPSIVPRIDDPKDPMALANRDKILFVDMKLPVSKDFLYQAHGVPQPDPSDDMFEPPAPPPSPFGGGGQGGGSVGDAGGPPAGDSFAALDISSEVRDAVNRMPSHLREHYIGELTQAKEELAAATGKPRYRGGQSGGGRWMAKSTKEALGKVKDIMSKWPADGQRMSSRYIKAFGLPDNSAEFRSYSFPDIWDTIDQRKRKVTKTTPVPMAGLKTTQSAIDGEKVSAMLQSTVSESTQPISSSPIVIKRSNRLWLWDGHHRAAKDKLLGKDVLHARIVDLDDIK